MDSHAHPQSSVRSADSQFHLDRWLQPLLALLALCISSDLSAQNPGRGTPASEQSPHGTAPEWRSAGPDRQRDKRASKPQSVRADPLIEDAEDSQEERERGTERGPANADPPSPQPKPQPGLAERESRNFSDPSFVRGGQVWREYNLAPYTSRLAGISHPEQAVVDWILKASGSETWHGEDAAVLAATRGRLRVFHRPDVQAQVEEIVDRFIQPVQPQVSMRVQFVTCTDLNWRNGLAHLLKPAAIGPDGQQVWLVAPEDASLIRSRLRVDRQSGPLPQQQVLANNGQPTQVEIGQSVNYISGLELTSGMYLAYQPIISRLSEGVKATFTPLWTTDGGAVDLELKLTTRNVLKLHYAQSVAPLSTGNQSTVVQVPEVAASSMQQTLRWPVPQVLLISAGVQPASAGTKRGPLSFSSPSTELLILAEIDPPRSSRSAARRTVPVNR